MQWEAGQIGEKNSFLDVTIGKSLGRKVNKVGRKHNRRKTSKLARDGT